MSAKLQHECACCHKLFMSEVVSIEKDNNGQKHEVVYNVCGPCEWKLIRMEDGYSALRPRYSYAKVV